MYCIIHIFIRHVCRVLGNVPLPLGPLPLMRVYDPLPAPFKYIVRQCIVYTYIYLPGFGRRAPPPRPYSKIQNDRPVAQPDCQMADVA
jgi:hypothetical protein